MVGIVEKRGRFVTARPYFETGRRITLERPRHGNVTSGELVLVDPSGRGGHGRVLRRIGRPDVARDVIEGFMLHRGLRRRFDPVVERAAREAAEAVGPREAG